MKNRKKMRTDADCDMPHSYTSVDSMTLGSVPFETEDDYGRNSANKIRAQNRFETYLLWFNDCYEAMTIDKVFKI